MPWTFDLKKENSPFFCDLWCCSSLSYSFSAACLIPKIQFPQILIFEEFHFNLVWCWRVSISNFTIYNKSHCSLIYYRVLIVIDVTLIWTVVFYLSIFLYADLLNSYDVQVLIWNTFVILCDSCVLTLLGSDFPIHYCNLSIHVIYKLIL